MDAQIKKIGNSKGVIIPSSILKMLNIKESDELAIRVEGKEIIFSKKESFDPQSLEELFNGFLETYEGKIMFDDDQGREI